MNTLSTYIRSLFTRITDPQPIKELKGLELSETILHNLVIERKLPGLAVNIIKQGRPIFEKGFGYADMEHKTKVNPEETIFRIASISKCITALAFGKMVEEGIVGFNDSFYKHVPYYPKKKYDFTLKQLASHTAGIRGYKGKEFALNKNYTIKQSIEVFKDDSLIFRPGKGYSYNSFDFVLLSLAMQEASGVPFEQYVKEKVLIPLGMLNTFPPESIQRQNKRSFSTAFYTKTTLGFKKAVEVNNFYKLAGGGYLATSKDVVKLGLELLHQKLLNKEIYQELITAQVINNESTYYGLGLQVSEDKKGHPFIGHVGSSVGAYSNLFVYPKKELVVAILVNCTDPKIQDFLDEAISNLLDDEI